MRRLFARGLCVALGIAVLAAVGAAAERDALDIAVVTDSRGAPGPVMMKQDIKLKEGGVLPYDKLWPVAVSKIEGVKLSSATGWRRLQTLSEIPPYLIREDKVYDVLIIQCGYDEYYRPEENKKRMEGRVAGGDIEERFVDDLKERDYEVRGSQLEKYTFETIRKYAKKVVYITINLGDFEADQRENERFKQLGVFDYMIELPLDPEWAPAKTVDGAHYNADGHAYVAEKVIALIKKIMAEPAERPAESPSP